jgi:PIN domain nuclease of toxin-antitoxin system
MTALLLDTNAFSMAITDDPRLSSISRDMILTASRVAVSAITFYEIRQKVRLGKWPEISSHLEILDRRAVEDGFEILPLTASAASAAARFEWGHRNPFDRMIAAVAIEERLHLLSSNRAFDVLGIARDWPD